MSERARSNYLFARATIGLDRESVGKVSMRISEGLVGLVLQKNEPVYVPDAISHPRYKYFPETGEMMGGVIVAGELRALLDRYLAR